MSLIFVFSQIELLLLNLDKYTSKKNKTLIIYIRKVV
jgi:hypothetical protein